MTDGETDGQTGHIVAVVSSELGLVNVVAYLHEVVLISCIRLLLANYLLIVAKIFKSAGRQTTARPAANHGPARPGPRVASGRA